MMKWHSVIAALDVVEGNLRKIHSKVKPGRLKEDLGTLLQEMGGLRLIINQQHRWRELPVVDQQLVIEAQGARRDAAHALYRADKIVRENMATMMADRYGVSYQQARLVLDAIVGDGTIDPGQYFTEQLQEMVGDLGDFLDYEDAG